MAEWLAPAIVQRRTRSAIRIASSLDDLTLQTGLTGAVYHHVVGVAIPTRMSPAGRRLHPAIGQPVGDHCDQVDRREEVPRSAAASVEGRPENAPNDCAATARARRSHTSFYGGLGEHESIAAAAAASAAAVTRGLLGDN
jgi:hypothetical protein